MKTILTQVELDAAIEENENAILELTGSAEFSLSIFGMGRPIFTLTGSARLRLVTLGSSAATVKTWGSSAATVETRDRSAATVDARDYARLALFGKTITAKATAFVSVLLHRGATADGGRQITVKIDSPRAWCDYYGVEISGSVGDGRIAVLYKSVDDDYSTSRGRAAGVFYRPGETPMAPDWDGGLAECGGGLHFSPTPKMALEFNIGTHFVACPVLLTDMRMPQDTDGHPNKIKAKGCCEPVYEVNKDGQPIPVSAAMGYK